MEEVRIPLQVQDQSFLVIAFCLSGKVIESIPLHLVSVIVSWQGLLEPGPSFPPSAPLLLHQWRRGDIMPGTYKSHISPTTMVV